MSLKTELTITPLQLQCHLRVVALRVVQTSLFLLDVALGPPGGNFPEGIKISGCWQIQSQQASGMHRLICVSVCIS